MNTCCSRGWCGLPPDRPAILTFERYCQLANPQRDELRVWFSQNGYELGEECIHDLIAVGEGFIDVERWNMEALSRGVALMEQHRMPMLTPPPMWVLQ